MFLALDARERMGAMHGHSRHGALVVGGVALVAAVAILVLVPTHRSLSAAGAAFFLVLALKHVALVATIGLPTAAAIRQLLYRPRQQGAPSPQADGDGYWRTGEAEPHRGVLRLEHDVRAFPLDRSPQAVVELAADKRMTLRFLADLDAGRLRDGLRKRYAKRGHRDAEAVERFLSILSGPIARGESLVIAFDPESTSTRLTLRGDSTVVGGSEFMKATWRLWFESTPAALTEALMKYLPSETAASRSDHAPGLTLHSPRFYDWMAAVYCLGREARLREHTLDVARVAASEHVLDVCCGTGTLALAARRRVGADGSVHGIDASPQMIARAATKSARSGSSVHFEVAAAQSLPFPDLTFDVVLCSLALHHLADDARVRAIAEMYRVVKPGGRVLAVEFGKPRGVHMLLHPQALLHARRSRGVVDGAVDTMTLAGLERVVAKPLGFAGLMYVLGQRPI
jgi:ubiquinone/menaquinone biosynthesis C-methylase UbiE